MKYKKFTANGYVFFYDSAFKHFPDHYKYVQYNSKGELCHEKIFDTKADYRCRYKIIFDLFNKKNARYRFAKQINDIYFTVYFFNEEFDFESTRVI